MTFTSHYHGPVDMAITGNVYFLSKAIASHEMNDQTVDRLRKLYVPVPEWTQATSQFDPNSGRRTIALVGGANSGRRITAVNLAVNNRLTPRDAVPDPEQASATPMMQPGYAYILSLDNLRDVPSSAVEESVRVFHGALPNGAALIVRAQPRTWDFLRLHDLAIPRVSVTPTDQIATIFRRSLLNEEDKEPIMPWWHGSRLINHLEGRSPEEAVRLADIVRSLIGVSGDQDDLISEALDVFTNWKTEIEIFFSETLEERHVDKRALMIAACILDGAPAQVIFNAKEALLDKIGLTSRDGKGLLGHGVSGQLDELKASRGERDIYRLRPGYSASFLSYTWRDRPTLRPTLQQWMEVTATSQYPQPAYALASLALEFKDAEALARAVEFWSQTAGMEDIAIDISGAAAMSEEIGREIRRTLYGWAKSPTDFRSHLIAGVCSGPMGRAYPQIALTRLRLMAEKGNEFSRQEAARALVALASDEDLRRTVLDQANIWTYADGGHRTRLGLDTLLLMARNHLLVPPPCDDSDMYASTWLILLTNPETASIAFEAVISWMEKCARAESDPQVFISVIEKVLTDNQGIAPVARVAWATKDILRDQIRYIEGPTIIDRIEHLLADRDPIMERLIDQKNSRVMGMP
ncbi:hypothetical protein [Nocardia thraciensis]